MAKRRFLKTFSKKDITHGAESLDTQVNNWVTEHQEVDVVQQTSHLSGAGGGPHNTGDCYLVVVLWYEAETPVDSKS